VVFGIDVSCVVIDSSLSKAPVQPIYLRLQIPNLKGLYCICK
jgi:hypothetical protein